MDRPLNASRFPALLVAIVLFITVHCPPLPGQSSEAATVATLDVLSAHYNRVTDTIKFELVNHGQKAATAYYLAFGVPGEKQVLWESGVGEDLLDPMLTSQCRYAGTKAPGPEDLWEGAIKPGDLYVHSSSANLPKNQLRGVDPAVRVAVVGIIWSDGSVEMPSVPGAQTGWVIAAIDHRLAQRKEVAQESARVVAILNAYPQDTDIQHQIGEAIKSLQTLMDDFRRAQQPYSSLQVSRVLSNLNNFVASPTPKEFFETYRAVFECQDKRRVSLLKATSSAELEQ